MALQIPIFLSISSRAHGSAINNINLLPPFTNCFGLSNTATNKYRTLARKAAVVKSSATLSEQQQPLEVPITSSSLANFPVDLWGDFFATISISDSALESLRIQTDALKGEAKKMFLESASDPTETIKFINLLYRLGLSYHFETDIEQQLHQIFHGELPHDLLDEENGYDLQCTATAFLVLRRQGYKMSCDVFNKFKDGGGKFKDSLLSDTEGLLSLYEASFLSCHGEDILDEARMFTKTHLEMLVSDHDHDHDQECSNINITNPHVRSFVIDSLRLPMHRGVLRLQARKYMINLYQHQKTRNETLLKFAKVDYNRVQLLHRQEIRDLSKWWNELNIAAEVPFGRNRLVEVYFWVNGMHFEPHFARARIITSKILTLLTYIDDLFDSYGTRNDRKLFHEAIQRWDYEFLDEIPVNYLKKLFKAFLDTFYKFENELMAEGRSFAMYYAKETAKRVVESYYQESEWIKEDYVYVPSLAEYFGPGEDFGPALMSTTLPLMAASSFMGIGEIAGVKEFEWLHAKPKICRAMALIGRIQDDIATQKFEQERTHIASSVQCYMKEYRASEKKAIQELEKMADNKWKTINEESMKRPHEVPLKLIDVMLNTIRFSEDFYGEDVDTLTNPHHVRENIHEFLMEDIET